MIVDIYVISLQFRRFLLFYMLFYDNYFFLKIKIIDFRIKNLLIRECLMQIFFDKLCFFYVVYKEVNYMLY